MEEFIMEIVGGVLELVLDVMLDDVMSRKVPMPLRIFLAVVFIAIFAGIVVVFYVFAIRSKSIVNKLLALVCIALLLGLTIHKIKKYKRKRS